MTITVRYRACDGYRETRRYKTLAAAQRWAAERIGNTPEFGGMYAISDDGIGRITVEGCTLRELFPASACL